MTLSQIMQYKYDDVGCNFITVVDNDVTSWLEFGEHFSGCFV